VTPATRATNRRLLPDRTLLVPSERKRWKVLDSYGCELFRAATLQECKQWLKVDEKGRKTWVQLTDLGGGDYDVLTLFGTFSITKKAVPR
jgi:hypothetical protein